MKNILLNIISSANKHLTRNGLFVLMMITGLLPQLNGQLKMEGSMEGGFPMKYTIDGISSNNISTGGMFGNIRSIAAEKVKLPVTLSVSINCTTPENAISTCDKYRLCYLSQYQPGSYSSKTMSDGGNSFRITISESDLVEDTIWGDYSAETAGKRVRVKKYMGAVYVLPEMYDVADGELDEIKREAGVNGRQGLAAFASTALNLDITIPIEVLGEKPKEEDPDRVEITITGYQYDSIANKVVVQGIYRSKTNITSATIFRSMGGTAVQGYINYSNNSFVAECAFERNVPNQFKIVFDNEAKLSAEQTINVNADGSSGSQTTTDASGNTTVDVPPPPDSQPPPDVPGLGPVGNVPGPQDIIKGIIGVVAPGLVGIIGGLLGGILGGGGTVPPPVVPQVPKPPIKKPTGPDDTPKKPEDDKKKKDGGKSKEEIEKEKEEKAKKEADEKAKKEAAEKEKRRKEAREKAKKLLDEQKKADEEMNSWLSQIVNTVKSAGADVKQGAKDVKDVMIPVITTIANETKSAVKDVINSPGIIVDTTIGTIKDAGQGIKDIAVAGKDIITHPIDIGWETVKGTAHDTKILVTETYGKAIVDMVKNPKKFVDFIYNASGGEDLIKSMDPNLSLVQRSGHYGLAVYKTILNTMGGGGIQQGGLAAVKAAGIRGITSTVQYGAARNAPVFQDIYHKVDEMSKAGAKHLGVELTQTQKLKITTGLFLDWYKKRYD